MKAKITKYSYYYYQYLEHQLSSISKMGVLNISFDGFLDDYYQKIYMQ